MVVRILLSLLLLGKGLVPLLDKASNRAVCFEKAALVTWIWLVLVVVFTIIIIVLVVLLVVVFFFYCLRLGLFHLWGDITQEFRPDGLPCLVILGDWDLQNWLSGLCSHRSKLKSLHMFSLRRRQRLWCFFSFQCRLLLWG